MKFILLNDFKSIFKEQKKWLLLYYIVFISYILFKYYIDKDLINNTFVLESFGLLINSTNVLKVTIFVFHIVFYIFIAVTLFFFDLKEDKCNLFLRMDNKKWYVYKVISIFFISIFLELIALLIFSVFSYLVSKNIFLSFFIKDILFILICQISTLTAIIFVPCFSFYLVIFYVIFSIDGNVTAINFLLEIILIIINFIFGFIFIIKNKCLIFEKC